MLEFTRTLSAAEVKSTYINLTDDSGRTYGASLPPHKTRLVIIDGAGRRTNASKHHDNQIWGAIRTWFIDNGVTPGTQVKVTCDPYERSDDGLSILRLMVLNSPPRVLPLVPGSRLADATASDSAGSEPELPLSLERQLEDFLVGNLSILEPGLRLYRSDDGREGRQYPTDVGVIDLLCVKANLDFLLVELKRGRSSDSVVGQISRYMGWVARHIVVGKSVSGLILTYERDDALRYAVHAHGNLSLNRYKVRLEIISDNEL